MLPASVQLVDTVTMRDFETPLYRTSTFDYSVTETVPTPSETYSDSYTTTSFQLHPSRHRNSSLLWSNRALEVGPRGVRAHARLRHYDTLAHRRATEQDRRAEETLQLSVHEHDVDKVPAACLPIPEASKLCVHPRDIRGPEGPTNTVDAPERDR